MTSKHLIMVFVAASTLAVALQIPDRTLAARLVGGSVGAAIGILVLHLIYKAIEKGRPG